MPAKTDKKKVADRDYIDASGKVLEDEQGATGVRYTPVDDPSKAISVQVTEPGKMLLAVFGLKTWLGNLYSQHDGDATAIQAKLAEVAQGRWPERQGGFGPRYDAEALIHAIAAAKQDAGLPFDEAATRKRITEEKGYAVGTLKIPAVLAHYNALTEKVADLASA